VRHGIIRSTTGSTPNPFMYTSQYADAGGALYKIGARYYGPGLGRWTQQDPLDQAGDLREGELRGHMSRIRLQRGVGRDRTQGLCWYLLPQVLEMTGQRYALIITRMLVPFTVVMFVLMLATDGVTDGKSTVLLIPGGAAILLRGALMLVYPETVLAPLARGEASTLWAKMGFRKEHRYGAVLNIIIGAGWIVMGVIYGA
jgi:RHS repeat-associated protein